MQYVRISETKGCMERTISTSAHLLMIGTWQDCAMPQPPVRQSRPRGRPRNTDGLDTAQQLVESAASVCAQRGFDGCTLARIAADAHVHPTAVYNHFDSRDDLLYAVAVRALDTLTAVAEQAPGGSRSFQNLAATYLQPDMREHRQILAEIHVASGRHERLATLLSGWHERWTEAMVEWLPSTDESPRATVQALFLLLLGLCHVDQLSAVHAPHTDVVERVAGMVELLIPDA
jgi:AcrR family transcriptional regulator